MNFTAALRKEWLEQVRTRRLLVAGVVLVMFGMLSPVLAKLTPEMLKLIPGGEGFAGLVPPPTLLDAVAQYIKNVSQFGVLLALLLSMGAIAQEKEKGTAAMMLVKPLPRGSFLLSKFVALSLNLLVGMLIAAVAGYYYTVFLFEAPDLGAWLLMNLLLWIYLLVWVAITLLFSTLVRSQAAAAGMSFGVILLFSILSVFPGIARLLPSRLLDWGASLFLPEIIPGQAALAVSLGLIVVSLAAAWLVFRKQEL